MGTCEVCLSPAHYADTAAPSNPLTHYIIVRADLPRGLQAAQMIHAAGESSPGSLPSGTFAIALTAPDEEALWRETVRLENAGVKLVRIYEPDEPYRGALMAIGLWPARKEALKRHLSSLPLLR